MNNKLIKQAKATADNIAEQELNDQNIQEMMSDLLSGGNVRDLGFSASISGNIDLKTRDQEYVKKFEMYSNTFSREMVKVIIARAIGSTHDNNKPFEISIDKLDELPKSMQQLLKKEILHITNMIDDKLLELTIDAQFFGDGFAKRIISKKNGIEGLITNFSTKPINITPIVSNKGRAIAYEISSSNLVKSKSYFKSNGRTYVAPIEVARLSACSNGINIVNADGIPNIERQNVFLSKELYYEDNIYGGVMEGCEGSFDNFKFTLNALMNRRIANSVIERFITHNLDGIDKGARKMLVQALKNQIKRTNDVIKDKVASNDPSLNITNHIIPITGNNVNGISIQESSPDGGLTIDDLMLHIKNYVADVGFNIALTPFGDTTMGGGERDGVVENSLQMDVQGSQIRMSIVAFVKENFSLHLKIKHGIELEKDSVSVLFTSILNRAKITAEQQRLEALGNTQQFGSLIEQYKAMGLEDSETTRLLLKSQFEPIVVQNSKDKEAQINAIIEIIFTKSTEEEM